MPQAKLRAAKAIKARAQAATGACPDHDYHVNVDKAVAKAVVEKFEEQHRHDLQDAQAPAKPGVYAIYQIGKKKPVYVGKASKAVRARLRNHANKIAAAPQLANKKYKCTYLVIPEAWWVVLAEAFLIDKYRPPWNGAGFASNAPGGGRKGIRKSLWQRYLDGDLSEEEAKDRSLPSLADEN